MHPPPQGPSPEDWARRHVGPCRRHPPNALCAGRHRRSLLHGLRAKNPLRSRHPLELDGELVGVFTASHHELDAFCSTQLRLLQGLCSHVAVAVQNARRFHDEHKRREQMTREAEEARSIQQALLPRTSPLIPGFCVSGLSIPAGAVGGDWYDYIPLPDGRWGLVLADVSGKGTAAALLMSTTRGMLRSLAPISCRARRSAHPPQQHAASGFPRRPLRHHGLRRTRSGEAHAASWPTPAICLRSSSSHGLSLDQERARLAARNFRRTNSRRPK